MSALVLSVVAVPIAWALGQPLLVIAAWTFLAVALAMRSTRWEPRT